MTMFRTFSAPLFSAAAALALSVVLMAGTVSVPTASIPAHTMEYVA